MTLKEMKSMAKRRKHLTPEEKMELAKAIMENKDALNIAAKGAIKMKNWGLLAVIGNIGE